VIILLNKEAKRLYICICNAVTESAVRECARNGACSLEQLSFELGVGSGCGRCRDCAGELLRDLRAAEPLTAAS
jgi:bacterioferritin-associated ferredoxin